MSNKKPILIPFNKWSRERIINGFKDVTSRSKRYNDPLVYEVLVLPWGRIKKELYFREGAESPEELQTVINKIFRKHVPDDRDFYVHYFDRKKMKERLEKPEGSE